MTVDRINIALSDVQKNPSLMRGILKGVKNVCNLASLVFHSPNFQILGQGAGLGDKTLKVFQSLDLPKIWWNYHYTTPFTLFIDVFKSILKIIALPLLLVELHVIPKFIPTPVKIAILSVEAFLALHSLFKTVEKIKPYMGDKVSNRCKRKVALWSDRRSNFENKIEQVVKIKHIRKPTQITTDEFNAYLKVYVQQKESKWIQKENQIPTAKKSLLIQLAFKIFFVAMMGFVLSGMIVGFCTLTVVGAGVAGIGVTSLALSKYFYDKFHPPVQGIRFKVLTTK